MIFTLIMSILVVLKTISTRNESTLNDDIILIKSSVIDNNILLSLPDVLTVQETYNNPFKCNKSINGLHSFTLSKIDGTPFTHDGWIHIAITLLFVKWKK
eukprot:Lithocolla_globosa_v1_NODE_1204_length_2791_cov_31.125457.p5 type:complete len:100 gc:universal NODE_1204_length_2791_cov_31.125457:1057-1356(+)